MHIKRMILSANLHLAELPIYVMYDNVIDGEHCFSLNRRRTEGPHEFIQGDTIGEKASMVDVIKVIDKLVLAGIEYMS